MLRSASPWALAALSPLLLLELLNLIGDRLGTDPLTLIGSGSGIGPGKTMVLLAWILVVAVGGCVHLWLRSAWPIALDQSWESAVSGASQPKVYVLPHPGEIHGHPFYRLRFGRFRVALLARLAYAPFDVARMTQPAGAYRYGDILEDLPYLEQIRPEIAQP